MTTPTDPTTLRTALEALVQKWSDEAISAMSNGLTEQAVATEWCASDLRAVLPTPAPAADEARCGHDPAARGWDYWCIAPCHADGTCDGECDPECNRCPDPCPTCQPDPTPVPPTPPATGTVERCAAGVEAVHAGIPTVVTCGEPRDSEAHEAGAPDFDHLFVAPVLVANPAPTPEPSPSAALVERAAQALHRWLGRRGGPHGKHWRYENCILSDVDTEGGKFIATFLAADLALAAARAEGLDGLTVAMVADAIHPEGQGPTIDCCMGSTVESLYPPDEAARLHRKHHEEAATRFLAYLAARAECYCYECGTASDVPHVTTKRGDK